MVFGTKYEGEADDGLSLALNCPCSRHSAPPKAPSASWGIVRSIPGLAPGASTELEHART